MKSFKVYIGDALSLNVAVQCHAVALGYSWEIQFDKPVFKDAHQLYRHRRGSFTTHCHHPDNATDPPSLMQLTS